ncbi:hypothetical protein K6L24_06305 [Erwinia persicina]|uniref:T6SS immunity protein Tli3 family protein n=1 Tax=Erwinia persicina TaxID=55211 RepID=UPI0007893246|nr:hypothetical protein [Erwinia persicina]QZQ51379.1 hypothetical protein K6L24_06305 [Erwinia persicina]
MKWNQSDRKVITIIVITGIVLYAIYKGLQFLAGVSMGASFGVGLGGMSGTQKVEESRKFETDAPSQIIYRIDKNRYLTLENYIACDKGGQVYYNDSQRGIKTQLGWDTDFYDFSYRRGNNISAYQGTIINGADNGYLAFPGASTRQYCGSGRSETGCPVFFFFSADYGKTFIYKIVAKEYSTPARFSQLKVVVANDGVYLRDESKDEPLYDNYRRSYDDISRVVHYSYDSGALINDYDVWNKKISDLVKKELLRKKVPYAELYSSRFDIYSYARALKPALSDDDVNNMVDELSDIISDVEKSFYKNKITFPSLLDFSVNDQYQCNVSNKATYATYVSNNGKKEVIKVD